MKKTIIFSIMTCLFICIFFIGCGKDDDNNGTGPSSDTESPSVTITYPATGFTTSGSVNITVEATDNEDVSKVELLIDGVLKSTDTSSPYSFTIDFSTYSEGPHSVVAKAYDSSDNTAVSSPVSVTYESDIDTEAPSVTITYPASGFTTYGSVNITVEANDNVGVSEVELLIDGVVKSTDTSSPYSFNIDFSTYSEGVHSVVAKAYDSSDNWALSNAVSITYEYDFAPSGDGYIKVEIIHYIEDGTLDALSNGDPYFIFQIVAGDDSTVVRSETYNGRFELWNPYYYEYNIDDNTKDFSVSVWVYDEDTTVDEWVDYTPDSGSKAYRFNLNTQTLPFEQTYNGSDDGIPSEPDCELQLRVSIVT